MQAGSLWNCHNQSRQSVRRLSRKHPARKAYRGENLWGVITNGMGVRYKRWNSRDDIPNRVLPRPLLQQEYHKCNDKSHEIPFPKECFLPSKIFTGDALFFYGGFDFCKFGEHINGAFAVSSQVGQVLECFFSFTNRSEPTGGFLKSSVRKASIRQCAWKPYFDSEQAK